MSFFTQPDDSGLRHGGMHGFSEKLRGRMGSPVLPRFLFDGDGGLHAEDAAFPASVSLNAGSTAVTNDASAQRSRIRTVA